MDIITKNPYRYLGVYSNSPIKDRVANKGKMNAFLKVGKPVSFPLDLTNILPSVDRSIETVANAESELALPIDQIKFAQFWWMNETQLDNIAFNHLANGNIEMAKSIWDKKDNVSSLQNRFLLSVINNQYSSAIRFAEKLYLNFSKEFIAKVVGEDMSISTPLWRMLIDSFEEAGVNIQPFMSAVTNKEWKNYIAEKTIVPLIKSLEQAIDSAKASRGKGPDSRLQAGQKLMVSTKKELVQLQNLLPVSDIRYQTIADKLATEILQCGIDYYNDSDDDDCATKAMKLQKYAYSIAVGSMARQRCKENVDILQKIIDELPPIEVRDNYEAIQLALVTFATQPELIKYSILLIKTCVPHIIAIKELLGRNHKSYLKISTIIVNNAFGNVIAEINDAQKKEDFESLKAILISAWRTQLYMDMFDLEPAYKEGRFKECRLALYRIIEKCKGFEPIVNSYMYKYGCGWCNNLDVSDVDLRTDDEYFASCQSLVSYKAYIHKFPRGKHISAVKSKIIELSYKKCRTLADYQKFLNDYPNSVYQSKALATIKMLIHEKEEREKRKIRQEKAISACVTLNDIFTLYAKEKSECIDINKCSDKAFELAKTKIDFQNVLSTFGVRTVGGRKAKVKIEELEREHTEKSEARLKKLKWILCIGIPILVFVSIYLIWGINGLAITFIAIAVFSGFAAFGCIKEGEGCALFFILAIIAVIFGSLGYELNKIADDIYNRKESKDLYEQIINNPTEKACSDYINNFEHIDNVNTNKVRDIWFNLLISEAQNFDYNSYKEDTLSDNNSSQLINPIQKLQEFIKQNYKTDYQDKAEAYIEYICDSLYDVADNNSTILGWEQYQRVVPTDYFRDSEEKKEQIENRVWSTESDAWKQAILENNILAYEKYKSLYPNGSHISACEKRLIDLEVSRIYAGEHGTLPAMNKMRGGKGSTSHITVTNSTSFILTILYSGPDSKKIILDAGETETVVLKNGQYRVAASVSASEVNNYAGTEILQGGSYRSDYYIDKM